MTVFVLWKHPLLYSPMACSWDGLASHTMRGVLHVMHSCSVVCCCTIRHVCMPHFLFDCCMQYIAVYDCVVVQVAPSFLASGWGCRAGITTRHFQFARSPSLNCICPLLSNPWTQTCNNNIMMSLWQATKWLPGGVYFPPLCVICLHWHVLTMHHN